MTVKTMRTIAFLLASATCVFSTSPAIATPGNSTSAHITAISSTSSASSPGVWVSTDGTIYNDNCTTTPGQYFLPNESYSPSNTAYKSQFAQLMAAYMTGKTVSFFISGCYGTSSSLINYVTNN